MALQIWADPGLAAKLRFEGSAGAGQAIGRGLAAFGAGIGQAREAQKELAEKRREEQKRESQEADALRKLAALRGYTTSDEAKTFSLGDLRGLVQANQAREHMEMQQAQLKMYQQHGEVYAAQAAQAKAEQANQAKAGGFWSALQDYSNEAIPMEVAIPKALSASGYSPTPADVGLLRQYTDSGQVEQGLPFGAVMPVPGTTGALVGAGGRSAQFQQLEVPMLDVRRYPKLMAPSEAARNEALVTYTNEIAAEMEKRKAKPQDIELTVQEFQRRAASTWKQLVPQGSIQGVPGLFMGGGAPGTATPAAPAVSPASAGEKKAIQIRRNPKTGLFELAP